MRHLDSNLLRTFLAISEAGSVTGGAQRIDRSQSATSLQIKQLEDIVGGPVFHRHGRGIVLTPAGERLLPVARKITRELDATLAQLKDDGLVGKLRIGLPDDHSRITLSRIVADFAAAHPRVELEVHCALGTGFRAAIEKGRLDLAVYESANPPQNAETLQTDKLVWMAADDRDLAFQDPLPVAVFDAECWWRDAALSSLEKLGRPYRVVFTSESSIGVRAAVASGIAIGFLSEKVTIENLVKLPNMGEGQPTYLVCETAPGSEGPICSVMRDAIRKTLQPATRLKSQARLP